VTKYTLFVCLTAALGGFLFGFDTAVISGAIEFIIKPAIFNLSDIEKGWAVGSILIGCILGCLFSGKPIDVFGRKKILILSAIFFIISACGSAISRNLFDLVIYRLIGGLGVGLASMLSPIYIAEVAPARLRGSLVALNQFTIVIGIVVAFFTNFLLRNIGGLDNWRYMLGVEAIPAILFLLLLFIIPESPRWLVKRGNIDQARNVLTKITVKHLVDQEITQIQKSIASEAESNWSFFLNRKYMKILFIGIGLAIFQQVTGINVIIYYAPSIFKALGNSIDVALYQTVAIGVVNLGFTIIAIWLVDRIGRRPLLIVGTSIMLFMLLALSTIFYTNQIEGLGALFVILGYCAAFSISLGPVVWVLIAEIFPNNMRGMGVSIAVTFMWAANLLVSFTFPVLLTRLNGGFTFLIYAFMCLFCLLFVWFMISETKGKSLEEIELSYSK
jgi:sugar porter (SP) family MFS transporter